MEGNALRSLFRAYVDMQALSQIKVKIFLRDDIWNKVVTTGFREASHITRQLTIGWDFASLLNLIVRRLCANPLICKLYEINPDKVLSEAALQSRFFYEAFPDQVDTGVSKPKTMEWMMSRTADGSKRTAPRELIHLLLQARDEQLKGYDLGNVSPDTHLFGKSAIRSALPAVSKARYFQTLCAEYPLLKPRLDRLEGERTAQSKPSLARLWSVSEAEATEIAERLVEVGFFERRGSYEIPTYWVPFLYRDALNMVQGTA